MFDYLFKTRGCIPSPQLEYLHTCNAIIIIHLPSSSSFSSSRLKTTPLKYVEENLINYLLKWCEFASVWPCKYYLQLQLNEKKTERMMRRRTNQNEKKERAKKKAYGLVLPKQDRLPRESSAIIGPYYYDEYHLEAYKIKKKKEASLIYVIYIYCFFF